MVDVGVEFWSRMTKNSGQPRDGTTQMAWERKREREGVRTTSTKNHFRIEGWLSEVRSEKCILCSVTLARGEHHIPRSCCFPSLWPIQCSYGPEPIFLDAFVTLGCPVGLGDGLRQDSRQRMHHRKVAISDEGTLSASIHLSKYGHFCPSFGTHHSFGRTIPFSTISTFRSPPTVRLGQTVDESGAKSERFFVFCCVRCPSPAQLFLTSEFQHFRQWRSAPTGCPGRPLLRCPGRSLT